MKFLKKRPAVGESLARDLRATDKQFAAEYPALFEHLVETEWKKGVPRVTSTLRLFTEDGLWKVALTDRDAGNVAFFSSDTLEGVLLCCDEQLQNERVEWRVDKYAKRKK